MDQQYASVGSSSVFLASHLVVEFHGCSREVLEGFADVTQLLYTVAVSAGATVIESKFHKFEPQGYSGVLILAESHLAVHTWPEHELVSLDLYTCGTKVDGGMVIETLAQAFVAKRVEVLRLARGRLAGVPPATLANAS